MPASSTSRRVCAACGSNASDTRFERIISAAWCATAGTSSSMSSRARLAASPSSRSCAPSSAASAPYARSTRVASATRLAGWLKGIAGLLAHERRVGSAVQTLRSEVST